MPESAPSFGVVYALWNHTREPGNLLDRLVGEVGIDHITIPVVTGREEQFRPFFFPETPYFGTEGGWHYPPGPAIAATGIKPHVAAWCGRRDVLRQVCDDARRAALAVHFRLTFAQAHDLCRNHPQLAATNAWGQVPLDPSACYSNPQFRALVEATFADLARYEPAAIQLDELEFDRDLTAAHWRSDTPSPFVNTCCCSSCRQIALAGGIPLDDAVAAARDRVLRPPADFAAVAAAVPEPRRDPVLREYTEVRRRSLNAWMHALAMAQGGRECWLVVGDAERVPPAGWERILRYSTFLTEFGLTADEEMPPLPGLSCAITPHVRPAAADLVVIVQRAVAGGTRCIEFDEVAECRFDVLTALKQAIRYARRG